VLRREGAVGKDRHPAPRIVFAGGGTGGHLFPGIAIAEAFQERYAQCAVCFISVGTRIERDALRLAGFPLRLIRSKGLKGKGFAAQLQSLAEIPVGVAQSVRILQEFRPDVVIGVGGYASGPVCLAAWLLGIPLVLHEQNRECGMTNRLLKPIARRLYVSFPFSGKSCSRIRLTGNPVRRGFLQGFGKRGAHSGFTVLVCGGSQGAHAINQAVLDAMDRIGDRIRLIHQTGILDETPVKAHYCQTRLQVTVSAFITDMAAAYAASDLVVCRAGATTIAEMTVSGKPAIFIPFPHATGDHQMANAMALVDAGAAECIPEKALSGEKLAQRILYLMEHPEVLDAMASASRRLGRPEAAQVIVDDVMGMLGNQIG
jgi:UDP-N-acetylglucosamine--N-acetylmuramyl-(pentapeptide) pyrophosphoryl-undecaprenol N-acetylglucosamine transferase